MTEGERIKQIRKKNKLTLEQFGNKVGVAKTTISRIENGTQMPSGAVLEALLTKLGTSTYQLCDIYYKSEKQLTFERECTMMRFREEHLFAWRVI